MRPKTKRDVALLPNNVLLNLQDAALVLSAVTAFLNDARYKCGAAYVSVVKNYSRFHPSPFTFSSETPINTGDSRGEGWR